MRTAADAARCHDLGQSDAVELCSANGNFPGVRSLVGIQRDASDHAGALKHRGFCARAATGHTIAGPGRCK